MLKNIEIIKFVLDAAEMHLRSENPDIKRLQEMMIYVEKEFQNSNSIRLMYAKEKLSWVQLELAEFYIRKDSDRKLSIQSMKSDLWRCICGVGLYELNPGH